MLPEDRVSFERAKNIEERRAIEDIRTYGVHILHVFDDKGFLPQFSYTVGLWHTHGHPEVLISGLKESLRHTLLNNINFCLGEDRSFRDGESATDLIEGYRCYFQVLPKDRYFDYLGWDRWFYDDEDFEAVQMHWPSVDNVFPWEKKANRALRDSQEVLTKIPMRIA